MKTTAHFQQTIKNHLDNRAQTDELFAKSYSKTNKNIEDCITYILNTVQKSGCNGFTDDEIFSMAVHYYDEDNIEVGKSVNAHVVVNHEVELTDEDKERAKAEAFNKYKEEELRKLKDNAQKRKPKAEPIVVQSLFDEL